MAKKKPNYLLYGLIALAVLLLVGVVVKNRNKDTGTKVSAEPATLRTLTEIVAASGKVFPVTEVKISSDVSGEVVELYVAEGDSVTQGQLLAKIDPDAYQSQVERGVASVNAAKAQAANSRAQLETFRAQIAQIQAQIDNAGQVNERNKQLLADGVIADAEFEAGESNLRALEANKRSIEANLRAAEQGVKGADFQIQSAQATLKELRTALGRTTLYAPVSGVVSLLNIERGERVVGTIQMTGTEMMRIANLNAMEVQVEVSENDIPRVNVGDPVDIEVDAYLDRTFAGRVSQIANSAQGLAVTSAAASLTTDQVTNFVVTIDMLPESYQDLISPSKPYPFRPGMSATVEIKTKTIDNALTVPIQAVTTRDADKKRGKAKTVSNSGPDDDLLEVVFVVTEADTAARRVVKTGIQDDTYIQILDGLEADIQVITGPYTQISRKLESGAELRVVEEEELYKED